MIPLRLEDVRRAWVARDPHLPRILRQLAEQDEEESADGDGSGEAKPPIREGALTFQSYLNTMRSLDFRHKPKPEQMLKRQEMMQAIEAPNAEVPLSDKLRLHEILFQLWGERDDPLARETLLKIIAKAPLVYGPWRALKKIFKEAEAQDDVEILAALAARFDTAYAGFGGYDPSSGTMGYMVRRGWRYLRRLGISFPVAFVDAAVEFLARYEDPKSEEADDEWDEPGEIDWRRTWIANHLFYHGSKQYSRSRFTYWKSPGDMVKLRAFPELWKRSPRPLFSLLERAKADKVRDFAASALKADFRASLREVEPAWVVRLIALKSASIDKFVIWVLENVPRFQQGAFRDLGLHDSVLKLLDSPANEGRVYAANYARTHARDLPVTELVRLANNSHQAVRTLASDLLQARDPRKEIGLGAWGDLIGSSHAHALAASMIQKHFGPNELTPAWFAEILFSPNQNAFKFAKDLLPQIHPPAKLGADYFLGLLRRLDQVDPDETEARNVASFAMGELARFDLNAIPVDDLKRLMLHPRTQDAVCRWIDGGKLKAQALDADTLKTFAYQPDFDADPWIQALKASDRTWVKDLEFDKGLSNRILDYLRDPRRFTPAQLGFEWLLGLVKRSEPQYHDFAVEVMIKGFGPADFAPPAQDGAAADVQDTSATVDFAGASFVFTGKMATMKREIAEAKVKECNGAVLSGPSAKLHYLVIGDDGSSLYGQGKKGSKQVKAEDLNAAGANIQIISEAAFLRMISGQKSAVSEDRVLAGSERLWGMAVAPGPEDSPLGKFAIRYLRLHHPDVCLAETDRPVNPGEAIPEAFLTFERVRPLFGETRKPLRDLGLELAKWEFARWKPPIEDLVKLSEMPFADTRKFVSQALLADDSPEHKRYRIDPASLTPLAVYSFCESLDEDTRMVGIKLIERDPRMQLPEELFKLAESPDRRVRAFVIRQLWALYRDRGVTEGWKPAVPPQSTIGATAAKKAAKAIEERGPGTPIRPEAPPASPESLSQFLRRILFEVPPGRLSPAKTQDGEVTQKLKPLPARIAKLSLVETIRDLALENISFAAAALPPLREFMISRGRSERDACLVAVTRISRRHPSLAASAPAIAAEAVS